MSRVAKKPIMIPKGVQAEIQNRAVIIKGPKGQMKCVVHEALEVKSIAPDALQVVVKESSRETFSGASEARIGIFIKAMLGTICMT